MADHPTRDAETEAAAVEPVDIAQLRSDGDIEAGNPAPLRRGWFIVPVVVGICAGGAIGVPAVLGFRASMQQGEVVAALRQQVAAAESRLAQVEAISGAAAPAATVTAFAERLAAADSARVGATVKAEASAAALEDRIEALRASVREADRKADAVREDAARSLAARASATGGAAGGPTITFPSLDTGPIETRLDALESRLTRLEAALSGGRAPTGAAGADDAGLAVAGQALLRTLASGAPFATDLAAVRERGADAAAVAALQPFADGGLPSAAALAAKFAAAAASLRPATLPAETDGRRGFFGALAQRATGLVAVKRIGEADGGTDLESRLARIETALDGGQLDDALAVWRQLPEPAHSGLADWGREVEARQAAVAAAQAIVSHAPAAGGKSKS